MDVKPMAVTVRFFANFREVTGKKQESIDGVKNVASLLEELTRRFGERLTEQLFHHGTRELRGTVVIFVNGVGLNPHHDLHAPLEDGDVVAIFPPVSGGKNGGPFSKALNITLL